MKRIKYACLEQTIHFMLKEDIPHDEAIAMMHREVDSYKEHMAHSRLKYKIISETTDADGSIMLSIKKQYNGYPCGGYLD